MSVSQIDSQTQATIVRLPDNCLRSLIAKGTQLKTLGISQNKGLRARRICDKVTVVEICAIRPECRTHPLLCGSGTWFVP